MIMDNTARGIRFLKVASERYIYAYTFGNYFGSVKVIIMPPDKEVVEEFKDVMLSTKGRNCNCAHWDYDAQDIVLNLNVGTADYLFFCFVGEGNSGSLSGDQSPKYCSGGGGHYYSANHSELTFTWTGTDLYMELYAEHHTAQHNLHHVVDNYSVKPYALHVESVNTGTGKWTGTRTEFTTGTGSWSGAFKPPQVASVQKYSNANMPRFRLKEPDQMFYPEPLWHFGDRWVVDPIYKGPRPTSAYGDILLQLKYDSFLNTLDSFKTASDNNIQNVAALYTLISDALNFNVAGLWDHIMKSDIVRVALKKGYKDKLWAMDTATVIKKFFGNLWLQYRYVFCTTVSDVKGNIDYISSRSMARNETWRVDGAASNDFLGTQYYIHCGYKVSLADEDPLVASINLLRRIGMLPTKYVIWDFVPFSFVADWFLNIGDYLGDTEKWSYINTHYRIKEFYYTLRYATACKVGRVDAEKYSGNEYTRWYSSPPAICYGASWGASTRKTSLKRLGDSAALEVGKPNPKFKSNLYFQV